MLHHHLTVMAMADEHRMRIERANKFGYQSDPLFLERRRDRRVRRRRGGRSGLRIRRR